jgi:small subunit ribosomal protein S6
MRRYESVIILDPELSDDEVHNITEHYTKVIKDRQGEVIKAEDWGSRKLAYLVRKKERGRYVLLDYVGLPDVLDELERRFKIAEEVMKYLSVKTDDNVDLEAFKAEAEEKAEADAPAEPAEAPPAAAPPSPAEESEEKTEKAPESKPETAEEAAPKPSVPAETTTPAVAATPAETATPDAPADATPPETPAETTPADAPAEAATPAGADATETPAESAGEETPETKPEEAAATPEEAATDAPTGDEEKKEGE